MFKYPKIQTVFERNPETKFKTLLEGRFSTLELEMLAGTPCWEFTEKVDGTNIRVGWETGDRYVSYGGRTDNAQIPAKLIESLRYTVTPDAFESAFGESADGVPVQLFGEGYGEGIQKGGCYLQDRVGFILFDVVIGGTWLRRSDVDDVAFKMGLKSVPTLGRGTLIELVEMMKMGVYRASRIAEVSRDAEGVVARPQQPLFDRRGKIIMTKLKYRDFAGDLG